MLIRWHVKTVPEVAKTLKLGGSNCSRHRQHENEESEGQFQCLPGTSIDFTLPTSILVHLKPTAALRLQTGSRTTHDLLFFFFDIFQEFFSVWIALSFVHTCAFPAVFCRVQTRSASAGRCKVPQHVAHCPHHCPHQKGKTVG